MAILKNLIVNGVARVIGDLTASKIIKQGGVSSLFLKADGSVDSTSYYHSGNKPSLSDLGAAAASHTHSYLPLSGGSMSNTNVVTNLNADLLDGNHASAFATAGHTHSNYLERLAWWSESDSHNVDNLSTGTTFAYTTHNAPTNGTIVAFSYLGGTYQLQLQGQYSGENLYFRNKNGDKGTWNAWRYVIHNGNIGSQSVKYADSAGNADTVDNKHVSDFYKSGYAYPYGKLDKPWHKVASFTQSVASTQINTGISFYVGEFYLSRTYGILNILIRNESNTVNPEFCHVVWSLNNGIDPNDFVVGHSYSGNTVTYNLYAWRSGWSSYNIRKIAEQAWGEDQDVWTCYDAVNRNSNCFASIPESNKYTSSNLTISNPINWSAISGKPSTFTPSSHTHTKSEITNFPTKVSEFENDKGYKTTDTTYSTATSNTLGLVKIGYTANGKNYPVLLSNGQMYVNVPWTDTNTTYNFSGTTFYSGNSSNAEHNANNATANGHYYYNSNGPSGIGNTTTDGALYVLSYSDSWVGQIAQDYRNGRLFVRGKNNGSWTNWLNVLDSSNYSSFALPLTGGTITGTLTISRDAAAIHYNNQSGVSQGWLGFSAADTPSVWMADGSTRYNIIHSGNIGSQSVNYATSAGSSNTATIAGSLGDNDTINMYAQYSNEINFGGGNSGSTIHFGYRATDSRPIPTEFIFGSSTGTANLKASKFIKTGSSDSYVLLGAGGHKAISDFATSDHTHDYIPLSGSINISGNLRFSREYTFQGYTPRKRGNGGGWNYKPFSIIDYSGSDFAHFGVYGDNNDLKYIYIGSNDYDSNDNLRIYPNGNINAGNFFANSDIRYKNIIESYYSLSDKIAQLPIIKYKWIDRDDDSIRIGSSALSVISIIPELVSYDNSTDFYSLDYATLGAIAGISACKEVEMLKLKIKELELEIIILKSKYNG